MNRSRTFLAAATLALGPALAQGASNAVFTPASDLKWIGAGVPGVATAVVKGDMGKGPSHFYLKYDAGFVAPVHHHSPDHYVTTVAGNLVLIVDGKEHRLAARLVLRLHREGQARRPVRRRSGMRDVHRRARRVGRGSGEEVNRSTGRADPRGRVGVLLGVSSASPRTLSPPAPSR